jgi:hypothetical protein
MKLNKQGGLIEYQYDQARTLNGCYDRNKQDIQVLLDIKDVIRREYKLNEA